MKKINIALIGNGYWGKRLSRYFKDDKDFNLKCICTHVADKIWNDKAKY